MPTYKQYLTINEQKREQMFQDYCRIHQRHPIDDPTVGDDFIDSIVDGVEDPTQDNLNEQDQIQ
jgi:hypothetical protein